MPESNILTGDIEIKVDGTVIDQSIQAYLVEVSVDQHSHLPHMFAIRLYDPKLEHMDSKLFDLTKEVEISAIKEDGSNISLIKGEITALEPEFGKGGIASLSISGFDKSHRLYRETKSQAFLNIKDSDLASQIAGNAGLSAQVDATSTVYDHIYQDNQTDLAFLMQRAWRIGYECFVSEGKLYFRKPPTSSTTVTLTWGDDLISFRPRATLAEQVDEVMVKGWDAEKLTAITGKATSGKLYPKNGDSKDGAAWAGSFGTGKLIIVDQPVVSQAEADLLAQARLDERSGAFVEAEGHAYRRPDIIAGKFVKLENLGTRFSGDYLVTQARHQYTVDGWETHFSVRGSHTGLLAEQIRQQPPLNRWPGIVTGTVTNTDDPNDWGRVKVKFPWMSDDAESWWARVLGLGAGPDAGFFAVPEVGDEVVVAFEHGDFNRPFVLGGTWNGQHAIPPEGAGAAQGEKPLVRTWHSRTGHWMAMYDNADNKVEIITVSGHTLVLDDANKKVEALTSGGHTLTMDDQGKKLEIKTSGGHKITLDDNSRKVTLESSGDVEIKSGMNMKIQAGANLDLQASGPVNIKGAVVNIN